MQSIINFTIYGKVFAKKMHGRKCNLQEHTVCQLNKQRNSNKLGYAN